jgi:CheY-like chemotaxis protein
MRLILIVEDDHDIRTALAGLLSEAGYSVCDAVDPARALEKLRSLRPDLVLLDYGLPLPEDGDAFLRAKVADADISGIPVILVTGYNLPGEMDGTVATVRKPFEFDELAELVARVVGPPQKPRHVA